MAGGIFVSYRRDDSRHAAGRLVDRLVQAFGSNQLFMDVDSIDIGLDFVKVLNEKVAACDVMLVVIGPQWLDARDAQGRRRLDDPHDLVRLEVETALVRDVRVVPILVDGAVLPQTDHLPPSLQPLTRRQSTSIAHERFGADADRIVAALQNAIAPRPEVAPPPLHNVGPADSERASLPARSHLISPELIRKVAAELSNLSGVYVAPNIPAAKLANARQRGHFPVGAEVMVLFDDTNLGSGKDGLVILPHGLIYYGLAVNPELVPWEDFLAHPVEEGIWIGLKVGGRSWTFGVIRSSVATFLATLRATALAENRKQ